MSKELATNEPTTANERKKKERESRSAQGMKIFYELPLDRGTLERLESILEHLSPDEVKNPGTNHYALAITYCINQAYINDPLCGQNATDKLSAKADNLLTLELLRLHRNIKELVKEKKSPREIAAAFNSASIPLPEGLPSHLLTQPNPHDLWKTKHVEWLLEPDQVEKALLEYSSSWW